MQSVLVLAVVGFLFFIMWSAWKAPRVEDCRDYILAAEMSRHLWGVSGRSKMGPFLMIGVVHLTSQHEQIVLPIQNDHPDFSKFASLVRGDLIGFVFEPDADELGPDGLSAMVRLGQVQEVYPV